MPTAFQFVDNTCDLVSQSSIGLKFACELAQLLADGRAVADPQDLSHLPLRQSPMLSSEPLPASTKSCSASAKD